MNKAIKDFGWGIWLNDERDWATLPPRLCKPTPHNTDLVPEILAVMQRLVVDGHNPELKRIPPAELRQLRKEHRGIYTDDINDGSAPLMSQDLG